MEVVAAEESAGAGSVGRGDFEGYGCAAPHLQLPAPVAPRHHAPKVQTPTPPMATPPAPRPGPAAPAPPYAFVRDPVRPPAPRCAFVCDPVAGWSRSSPRP
ncbi:hypothetical protein GCM10010394_05430 [Streptomyces crystallinus]|uniref:Uncharacterized protein n=1 Tax=Streptomyces crystallinus TaxID=68191 RepID=A0ABN1F195_9ACTN